MSQSLTERNGFSRNLASFQNSISCRYFKSDTSFLVILCWGSFKALLLRTRRIGKSHQYVQVQCKAESQNFDLQLIQSMYTGCVKIEKAIWDSICFFGLLMTSSKIKGACYIPHSECIWFSTRDTITPCHQSSSSCFAEKVLASSHFMLSQLHANFFRKHWQIPK